MSNRFYSLLTLFIFSFIFPVYLNSQTINIAGSWQFQTDPNDVGIKDEWFKTKLNGVIKLPGSMTENGLGDKLTLKTQWTGSIYDSSWFFNPRLAKYRNPNDLKFSFWLTPTLYYAGPAWYQKEIEIPQNWKGKNVTLFLERPHWESLVWVDNSPAGMQNSLSVPHKYDLTSMLSPGKHIITIRIDNRTKEINVGPDSHSITDHTQGNWNGIVGKMELVAANPAGMADVQVFPDVQNKQAVVKLILKGASQLKKAQIVISASLTNSAMQQEVPEKVNKISVLSDTIVITYPMGDNVQLWDEFSPSLYNLKISLTEKSKILDAKVVLFGMREIKVKGTRFFVNGNETFLRGTVENSVFPLTGYMPMDEASWVRVFKICKAWGLNHMRFHSVCPPEVAFVAADKTGFYLQPEGPSWANHGTSLGDGKPIDKYIWDETERIVNEYGNHASFTFYAYGNEPRGRYVAYLDKWVIYWKNKDNRRLYTGASTGGSWQIIPQSEFLVRARPRGLNWKGLPETTFDYANNLENQKVPYVTHEMGQWCVFPNFAEIPKYTGYLKAKNFEMFQEDLADKNMGDLGKDFLLASGKLQTICYKAEIEAALRTPGLAGFQLLSLNDYPGQGTALVGLLDALWEEKGYATAKEFNQFCAPVVPLVRLPKFVFTNNQTLIGKVEVANFSPKPIPAANINWKITDKAGIEIFKGKLTSADIQTGNCISLGNIEQPLSSIKAPQQLKLEIAINEFVNTWDIWVYPAEIVAPDTSALYTCTTIDAKAIEILNSGGKVLVLAAGKVENGKEIVQQFTPVFWNTSWFKMRPPHTTGILVKKKHPVFKNFPTDYFSNYQWYEIVNKQQVMNLDSFPAEFKSIVQPIDTWFINRKLGLLFEANVGKGKIMVCSADLTSKPAERIVARQLLSSIYTYMNSTEYNPEYTVDINAVRELFEIKQRKGYDSYTKDSPDELKPNYVKPAK